MDSRKHKKHFIMKYGQILKIAEFSLLSIIIWVNGYYFGPFHRSFFYYFVRVWSTKYIYLGKMQFTFSVFLIIYSHLSLFWHSIFKRFRLKWSLTCTKSRFIMKWSQKCVIFLSRTICWMALILSLFVGICSIISLDFDENNLIQRKYSALNRYINAKK